MTCTVCEDHPDKPWEGEHACACGGAGSPCRACNTPTEGVTLRMPTGFKTEVDKDGCVISDRGWAKEFDAPIDLADGTLREAIQLLGKTVPKSEHLYPKAQTAATCLTDAGEGHDFMMHVRIAVLQGTPPQRWPPRHQSRSEGHALG
jgi:hypothetical protein